ncbi:MAG: response regulator [Ignavibacteria bacterium]|nr:response regulator [Ignavibacteria bacterium]
MTAKDAYLPRQDDEGHHHPLILAVDDNQTSLELMRDLLLPSHRVLLAANGEEGLHAAKEVVPDLVISDVTMPTMDGYQLCQALKKDLRTSHIPVILLTARIETENRISGYESGADAYVTKPFVPEELLARVANLLTIREQLRERFRTGYLLKPGGAPAPSMQDQFLDRVNAVLTVHLGTEHIPIENICREVGMSRSQIHRKLVAMTGMSLSLYFRRLRLDHAMDLLRSNSATVSEIAFRIGFGSVAYFSKCFRDQFGMPPSHVRTRYRT